MYAPMTDDDTSKKEKQKGRELHELQNELFLLQESNADLLRKQERLEVDVKKARTLLAREAKEFSEMKALMAKQQKELEENEYVLKEIEKQVLNNETERKRIDRDLREVRRG